MSTSTESRKAGVEAATRAMQHGALERADLALLFATSKHDPTALRDAVRAVVGPRTRLIGGGAVGVITNDAISYGGYEVGIALIQGDSLKLDMFLQTDITDNEEATGYELGQQIAAREYTGERNLLLMYDSVKASVGKGGFGLNLATPLLGGLQRALGSFPRMAGLGLLGDMQFNATHQFFDDEVVQRTASALVLSGGVRMDTMIMHGCKPAGGYYTITKADGTAVLEIDGRPALEMVSKIIGADRSWEDYPLFVTLGVNRGEKFGAFDEELYANRLCMAVDKDRGALIMFEPDLTTGTEVQFMRRSVDFEYIGRRAEALYERTTGRHPFFALYIDCAGRASAYCASEREEAEEVQATVGRKVPLLGLYSGVEIAKVGDAVQPLDWTGVLCLFSD